MSLLDIQKLELSIEGIESTLDILYGVDLQVDKDSRLGLVGESGSGKTMTMRAVIRLLPKKALITGGKIFFKGENLLERSEKELSALRGKEISIIFQDASAALNPVYSVGSQIADVYRRHHGGSRSEAWDQAIEILDRVAFPEPGEKAKSYPHQLSGGMCQRAIIAMALICSPGLLIADEPTTGLDVTIQNQVLDLVLDVVEEINATLVFISHDIELVSKACSEMAVMYAGRIVEFGPTNQLLDNPFHFYTLGLVNCYKASATEEMPYIEGSPPDLSSDIPPCPFEPRCDHSLPVCRVKRPSMEEYRTDHFAACHYHEQKRADRHD